MLLPLLACTAPIHPTRDGTELPKRDSPDPADTEETGDPDTGVVSVPVVPWAEVVDGLTGPPNSGAISPTVELDLGGSPSELRASDLDSDGHDELLLLLGDELRVAEVDAVTGAASLGDVIGEATSFDVLGHHQVLLRRDGLEGVEVLTLQRSGDGWISEAKGYADDPGATQPIGDIDGDGYPDLASLEDDRLRILHAPSRLADSLLDTILDLKFNDDVSELDQVVVTGDVDGDGQEDLVVQRGGYLHGLGGPIEPETEDNLTEVLSVDWMTSSDLEATAVGIVDDLDGDGQAEVFAVQEHLAWLAEAPGGPWASYPSPTFTHTPGRRVGAMAAWGGGAGWWYGVPGKGQSQPDATAVVGAPRRELMARLGSADPVDYVWTESHTLYVVPAYGGLVGGDVDRDGSLPPDDCDDEDAGAHPGAIDVSNGKDDDCDGVVDQLGDDIVAAAVGGPNDVAGGEVVAWAGGDHDWVAWPGQSGLVVADLETALQVAYRDGPDTSLTAGDYDGDGQMDLVGSVHGWTAVIAYGSPETPEVVQYPAHWIAFSYADLVGDLDDDGLDDLIVAPQDFYFGDHGWAYYYTYQLLTYGSPERPPVLPEERRYDVPTSGRVDGNGDGVDDRLFYEDPSWQLVLGPLARGEPLDAGDVESFARCSGCDVRGAEFDGDGLSDDLIATASDDEVILFRGPMPSGAFDLATEAEARIQVEDHASSTAVAVANDWVFLGRRYDGDDAGAVYGFPLTGLGDVTLAEAAWKRDAWEAGLRCGTSLAVGDVNGDGVKELLVGCPGYDADEDEGAILAYRLP